MERVTIKISDIPPFLKQLPVITMKQQQGDIFAKTRLKVTHISTG